MSEQERQKWNQRYRQHPSAAQAPHPFVVGLAESLPREGRALDVAGGRGRHALWLLGRGLEVTLLDIAEEGLRLARQAAEQGGVAGRLVTQALDLDEAPLPSGPFDLVLNVDFLCRPVYRELGSRVAPGGLLVVVHPTRRNLERHGSPGERFLLDEGELPALIGGPGLEVVRAEEGWSSPGPGGRHESRLALRRLWP
jgi:SAM-dependent methyltransferase